LSSSLRANPKFNKFSRNILSWGIWNSWLLNTLLAVTATLAAYIVITATLTLSEQIFWGLFAFCMILIIRRRPWGRASIIMMIVISIMVSLRYIYWRLTNSTNFITPLDAFLGWGLVLAELYSLIVLLLGYVQTAMPLQRPVMLMPPDQKYWPTVDIMIPTYNESLSVVQTAILAAQSIDWPADKLRVHLLDDGRREEFREFCDQAGANYITRENNLHNKAGNLNAALRKTDGDYVAIFDCDHIPTRSFLQASMGWFLKNPKLAMVQTPHFFFSPDPFEKNLDIYNIVPNEGVLFYGLVQDGNDLWNASFFCGSCAILERKALMKIGGIATETVTEDAHTALKLSRKGYDLAYLAIPQSAGLATESLSGHIVQRRRWARGMAQIFRIDNPLLGRGLTIWQRLCYSNAMMHFFYALPRLVFLTAPLGYLLLGAEIFSASAAVVLVYALPHILISTITNSQIQGKFRHSFWNEVYETALSWHILFPVLLAMVNPKFGAFNATAKGGIVKEEYVDWNASTPYLILLAINLIGFSVGIFKLITDYGSTSTLLINLVWVLFNIIIISAAANTAKEARQLRKSPRIYKRLAATIHLPNGKTVVCKTSEFSQIGLDLKTLTPLEIPLGERILISIFRGNKEVVLPGTVTRSGNSIGVLLEGLTVEQQKDFTQITFSRADNWIYSWDHDVADSPLRSFGQVMTYGILNLLPLMKYAIHDLLLTMRAQGQRKSYSKR